MSIDFDKLTLQRGQGIADKTLFSRVMCETLALEPPKRLLDIGCGSGIVGIYALNNNSQFVYFNDIQTEAIQLTTINLKQHHIPTSDYQLLNHPFQDIDLSYCEVDAIAFNPPQLPTDMVNIEQFNDPHERIFRDGGANGLLLIHLFIDWLSQKLPNGCKAYLGVSSVLLIDQVLDYAKQHGLNTFKKHQQQVPLRPIFYASVEQMSASERQARDITQQQQNWLKTIYCIEFQRG